MPPTDSKHPRDWQLLRKISAARRASAAEARAQPAPQWSGRESPEDIHDVQLHLASRGRRNPGLAAETVVSEAWERLVEISGWAPAFASVVDCAMAYGLSRADARAEVWRQAGLDHPVWPPVAAPSTNENAPR